MGGVMELAGAYPLRAHGDVTLHVLPHGDAPVLRAQLDARPTVEGRG